MKIKKAIIPAAGLGTRVLPATKAIPKEMFPIVDKPAIQYIVEEAAKSGIEDIMIITSRGKSELEDHFDRNPELESKLEAGGNSKKKMLDEVVDVTGLANITFIRQHEQKGLGHAVLQTKRFVGDEPFAVLYGDDVIIGEDPCIGQLIRAYEETGLYGAVAIKEVSKEDVCKYSSMKLEPLKDNIYKVTDMIEKPAPGQEFSLFSILGRCILPSEIFDILEEIPYGAGGELQLTDAMKILAQRSGFAGVDFTGTRYDMGNKLGILKAQVEVGLSHPEIGADFKEYIKNIAENFK
ncbi:MAG: UTP--glucose-1-phosphate uridylyltransferase [Clostridium sp.]|nr:UTP--glucose-1-phosphate uridylyltransferase [Clostridium sp.]MCM1547305.1 UTP--glucose-1-phosphate uridylyltransferase [Ruminococcus sp.]